MSKSTYKRVILSITHPDGRIKTVRVVYRKISQLVCFLDRYFDKGYKVSKGKMNPETCTIYLGEKKSSELFCKTKI